MFTKPEANSKAKNHRSHSKPSAAKAIEGVPLFI